MKGEARKKVDPEKYWCHRTPKVGVGDRNREADGSAQSLHMPLSLDLAMRAELLKSESGVPRTMKR